MSNNHVEFIDDDDGQNIIPANDNKNIQLNNNNNNNNNNSNIQQQPIFDVYEQITETNIISFYNIAKTSNDSLMMKKVRKFISSSKISYVLKLYQDTLINLPELKEIAYLHIIKNLDELKEDDVKNMTYDTLVRLLSTDPYPSIITYNVESKLLDILLCWFTENENKTDDIAFMACWNKINKQSVLSPFVLTNLTSTKQYKRLESELSKEVVPLFVSNFKLPKNVICRTLTIKPNTILTREEEENLKVGDKVDALDVKNTWYIGTVKAIGTNAVLITFSGWKENSDEWLSFGQNKLAKYGSYTEGIEHDKTISRRDCECNKCQFERQQFKKKTGCGELNCTIHKKGDDYDIDNYDILESQIKNEIQNNIFNVPTNMEDSNDKHIVNVLSSLSSLMGGKVKLTIENEDNDDSDSCDEDERNDNEYDSENEESANLKLENENTPLNINELCNLLNSFSISSNNNNNNNNNSET
jgi:hypothetical protein